MRLVSFLTRGAIMAVSPVPRGMHTVTPHLVVRPGGGAAAMAFYQKAFAAQEVMRMTGPDGKGIVHSEMKIGDSTIFLGEEWPGMRVVSPEKVKVTTVSICLYVDNVDEWFNRAVAAGCQVSMPLMNMFWGDRYGKVTDPFGHEWALAQHIEDVSPEDMVRRYAEEMKKMAGPK
jgi:PhnB protein